MPLSKQTTDQIRKEAENYSEWFGEDAYKAGANMWAVWKEKAEVYELALKTITKVDVHGYNSGTIKEIATKAIESFNQNKVK